MSVGPAGGHDWNLDTVAVEHRLRGHGLRRQEVLPVVVALLCVVLAAVVMRLSEPAEDYQVVRTVVGRPATLNDGSTVTVTAVRAGTGISRDGNLELTTKGVFVVVDLQVSADTESANIGGFELASGSGSAARTYLPYESLTSVTADPGFTGSRSVIFEVDPARMDDLVLTAWDDEIIHAYQQRVVLALGITSGNVEQWQVSARDRVLDVSDRIDSVPTR